MSQEPGAAREIASLVDRNVSSGATRASAEVTVDDVMPMYHFGMRHTRLIDASPEATWQALHEISLKHMAIGRVLSALRSVPIRLLKRDTSKIVSRDLPFLARPPVPVLIDDAPRRLILAGMRKPWQLGGGPPPIGVPDLKTFTAFDETGWTKLTLEYRLDQHGGSTRLTMETRVWATDEQALRAFGRYWLIVRPAGGLLRRSMLKQIERLAKSQR